ncbi:TPA: MFS transporter [Pseudomonas aeruginosa]|nr:MFS transporter [Pseudomonas aeruginosa]HBP4890803.1 MFS transporter [Pseudomonas aeruginosa]
MNSTTASSHNTVSTAQAWLLWAGFILVSLNLRLIFTTVGPLLNDLKLGFTATLLVTTLPLALLGIFSMAGVRLRHWLGEERALFFALLLLTVGCSVRGLGEPGLIAGTIVGSAGIAVMNVIMPVLARKRFGPQRMGMVMGIYSLMLGAGAALGASVTLPLFQLLGADQASAFHTLGLWAIPAVLALLLWMPQLRHAAPLAPPGGHAVSSVSVYRNSTAWAITLFFGLQVLNLFVFLPWMPTLLKDRGASIATAALVFSFSQLSLMVASFVAPMMAARSHDHRVHIATIVLLCMAGTLGLMYAPLDSAMVWACLLGFGQGAGLSLGAFLFVAKAASIDSATRISAMAQTVGYLIAVSGPLLVGTIYQRTGDWNLPVLLLTAILVVELVVALPAGRNVKV